MVRNLASHAGSTSSNPGLGTEILHAIRSGQNKHIFLFVCFAFFKHIFKKLYEVGRQLLARGWVGGPDIRQQFGAFALQPAVVLQEVRADEGFPGSSAVKSAPAMQETPVRCLGQGDPLEKGQAAHSSIVELPWWLRR